jgi:thiol:disulfide interchange protein
VDIESNRKLMKELGVIPLRADFTKEDAAIRAVLLKFNQNSVPLNLIYAPGMPDSPRQLPVLLTPGIVSDNLRELGAAKLAAVTQ